MTTKKMLERKHLSEICDGKLMKSAEINNLAEKTNRVKNKKNHNQFHFSWIIR